MPVLYQVAVKQRLLLQELRNVFYYEAAVVLSDTSKQELADAIRKAYVDSLYGVNANDQWSLYGIDTRRVDIAGLLGNDWGFTLGSLVGGNTAETYATQIALLVLGKGTTIRPNQVRSYLGGWSENAIAAGGVFQSSFVTIGVDFIIDMNAHVLTAETVTRQSAQWATPSATHVVDWNPLTTYEGKSIPATQRRRRLGVGI